MPRLPLPLLLPMLPASQVFPKMLDTYLLVLYMAMVPVVYLQYRWLYTWITVYQSGAVAVFMWVSHCLSRVSDQLSDAASPGAEDAGAWLGRKRVQG